MQESESSKNSHHENSFYKGLFYGVVLGLGLVWFLGTKSGKKLKDDLLTKGEELVNRAGEELEELPDEDGV